MRSNLKKRLEHRLGKEVAKKALLEYMTQRGYDNQNMLVYPPAIYDIGAQPDTFKKVELVPFQKDSDPTTNAVVVGWNMFVLGTNRLYLGTTTHTSLAELQGGITESSSSDLEKTSSEIIEFILRVLDDHEDGFKRAPQAGSNQPGLPTNKPRIGPSASGGYYERNRLV